jgi:hypothetical protein
MTVIQMSERELTRLRVLIDLSDKRLTVGAAATLMGLGRRQVYRLRCAFACDGPATLVSRKRGRASNHRHGDTFRRVTSGMNLHESHRLEFAYDTASACRPDPIERAAVLRPIKAKPFGWPRKTRPALTGRALGGREI